MRDPFGKGASRIAPLRARADGLLRARAQRRRRAGYRAEKPRSWPAYLLRAHSRAGYRPYAVSLDLAELSLRLPARLCRRDVHVDSAEPGKPAVTPLTAILSEEIARSGPISFHRFMDAALYDSTHGYYRQPRDPFGKDGDFFTAEQLQPVFGILIAARIRMLYRDMGEPSDFTVVELGPGRGEMVEHALACWKKVKLVPPGEDLPDRFQGVVFSNEFFDALP